MKSLDSPPLATAEEMNEAVAAKRKTSRFYPSESAENKNKEISKSVAIHQAMIKQSANQGQIRLCDENLPEIQSRVNLYLDTCIANSTMPTLTGLAPLALGYSARGLRMAIDRAPASEWAKYMTVVREALADIMLGNGIKGATNPVLTIFALRNLADFSNIDHEPINDDIPERAPTAEELLEKYKEFADMDYE